MKVIVRWVEEMAMEVETDDPGSLQRGLPDEDLCEAECVDCRDWTWETRETPPMPYEPFVQYALW